MSQDEDKLSQVLLHLCKRSYKACTILLINVIPSTCTNFNVYVDTTQLCKENTQKLLTSLLFVAPSPRLLFLTLTLICSVAPCS